MKLSRIGPNIETISKSAGCFTILGVLIVTISTSHLMFKLAEYLVINCTYGHAAWAQGLRVTDNKGHLSNGDSLSGWASEAVYGGGFLLTVPFFLGSYLLFGYIGLRLSGRRLSDPPPKKKWDSSNKPPRTARRD